ncbi:hypothetical protein TNCV_4556761 [Trichonephila clavipes]|nr:hypothetical protein TNCV_4556761 [Trichonephila clavipes]
MKRNKSPFRNNINDRSPLVCELWSGNLCEQNFYRNTKDSSREEIFNEIDEIGNVIEEVVDLARQINLEIDCDDIQELLDSHNQGLTIDEEEQGH